MVGSILGQGMGGRIHSGTRDGFRVDFGIRGGL